MHYTLEIEINKPVQKVVELFDNPDNLPKWMEGLEKFEAISGTPGQVGATSKLTFKMKNRTLEMIETITVRNLPAEFSGTYDAKGVHNIVKNYFTELPGNRTKYTTWQEFQFKGIMKVFAFLMPGMFKKQSLKYLNDFKKFAESQN
ncbi:MAG: SRPBCC family protein [Bacteroidetes bacterium]|nr:SRPBCC family protein [Bacteroidota bacterium]